MSFKTGMPCATQTWEKAHHILRSCKSDVSTAVSTRSGGKGSKSHQEGTPSSLTPSLIRESEIYSPHDKNPGFSCFQMGAHLLILWGMPISRSGHRHCEHVSSATLQSTENVLILSFSENQNPGNGTVCAYSLAIS